MGLTVTYSLAQSPRDPRAFADALDEAVGAHRGGIERVPAGAGAADRDALRAADVAAPVHRLPELPGAVGRAAGGIGSPRCATRSSAPALVDEEFRTRDVAAASSPATGPGSTASATRPTTSPIPDSSIAAVAAREGRRPEEVALDWLLEDDGKALLFAPLGSYVDQDHEVIREMISHPASIVGLSDGGAHCGLICDASFPTYLLTHWTRDRTRGELLPLELVVHKQTGATAAAYGLTDRGTLAPGMKADVNVIDVDALHLHAPEIITDLPAGGRRLVQRVDGYRWTVQSGQVTFEDGHPTGARPGSVIRREPSTGG